MQVTPMMISIMLACHYSSDPASAVGPPWDSPYGCRARQFLFVKGMIDTASQTTLLGRKWVQALCGTPIPTEQASDMQERPDDAFNAESAALLIQRGSKPATERTPEMTKQIDHVDTYAAGLSEDTRIAIILDREEMNRVGFIGGCQMRQHASLLAKHLGVYIDDSFNITSWMTMLSVACYRYYAVRYLVSRGYTVT